jgi:glyoxylase-like metal-dependent hydrolase (beta-lactamase superfamily II)
MFSTLMRMRAIATILAAGLIALPASAAAPMAKFSAPAFYRLMVGDFEVTALNDGTHGLPVEKLLTHTTPEKVAAALAKAHLTSPVETSFNGFLINTGAKLVLIDCGAGSLFGPNLGHLLANLKASGYQPEQVDEIYITHFHPDHVGGLISDGQMAFPNAVVRADSAEAGFWLSPENMDKAPEDKKGFFKGAIASLNPYIAAGKFKPFEGAVELVPGVTSHPSHGHTPGHSSYLVESKGQTLILIGDLIHVGAVQFDNPSVTIAFDSDSKAAEAERKKQFAAAAKEGVMLGGAHLPFSGLGYLQARGKGYVWQPVNFVQMH